MEHTTSLEMAMEQADGNFKEAKRLLEKARAQHAAGEIDADRLASIERLYETAVSEVQRTHREA
ncbi:hypothetical protein [Zhihengliuella sp.]|uniref:hypothetical protein n=1 Tax=Zhihengliuella sp. TaxID=1954483 RepID=UPI002810C7CD|nr:hypothetical protein [Zhihengliuella sp.]